MTPEQISALLSSRRSTDRMIAARELVANPTLVDRAALEGAFHRETTPGVRQQFLSALEALDALAPRPPEPGADQTKRIFNEAHNTALRTISEQILHQMNPLIGDIDEAASSEIANYGSSQTRLRIEQIRLHAEAIAKFYHAAKPATFEEFDLAATVKNCMPRDLDHSKCQVSFVGPSPLMIQSDPSLVTIAVTNGVRNALEACLAVASDEHKPPVTISWNITDRECWISILDEGEGFSGNVSAAFEIGSSTKNGHLGHGLPGIRAAMLSLSGAAELIPKEGRGCSLVLTWPIIEAKK